MDNNEFTRADTGLGTTFERWSLNRVLLAFHEKYNFQSVLEGPGDGMTGINGINSLILGLRGIPTTLALNIVEKAEFTRRVWEIHAPQADLEIKMTPELPFPDNSFDLVWNFNVMTRSADPRDLLGEMVRTSKRFVFFCVPNAQNYSFWLHRLHHKVANDPWDHGDISLMRPAPWKEILKSMGLTVKEVIYLDCPWWPDIVDLGQLISDFFPFLRSASKKAKPENRMKWEADALPYYQIDHYPLVHQQMEKLAYFENSQIGWLKRLFSHHVGVFIQL